ncbi:SRPBCC family protein [Kitasatospora sp. NPDC058218]|uniref:SRPBCC family protein n=1 Tax=Kitasatospora sp. NPDC058218 TaxID=3346385 RepID=UPI0036DBCF8A
MARHLRPETLDFVGTAPVRLSFTARLAASPEEVFRELAQTPQGWPAWVRLAKAGYYVGHPPYGIGTDRRLRLHGGVRVSETVLVWESARHFAYRIDEVNVPGVRAMIEEWRLTPGPQAGTGVRWTIALDTGRPAATLCTAARAVLGRAFQGAMRRLDARIAASPNRC